MTQDTPAKPGGGADETPLSVGQYEFDEGENVNIERAGASAAIWAVCAIVGAVLLGTLAVVQYLLDNLRGAVLVLPLFLICAAAGWLYLGVGRSLKAVTTTEGNDVELLMGALQRLAKAFRNEVIVTALAVLVFAALAVATRI